MSLADEFKAAIGYGNASLGGEASIYSYLARGANGRTGEGSPVYQTELPQGGSECLRWASHKELVLDGERAQAKAYEAAQRAYCPYTNPVR